MASERALRAELDALARKRETLNTTPRNGEPSRRTVFSRLGGSSRSSNDSPRFGGRRRDPPQQENTPRGNSGRRLGKRGSWSERQDTEGATKRQRLHSAVARPEGGGSDDEAPQEDGERAEQLKKRAVAPYTQKEGIARSRRMFGALMGHLGRAKKQIEKDTDLFKRQDSKQHEAEEKEKQQSLELATKARRDATVQKLEAAVARTELEMQEALARKKLQHLQSVKKSASLSKFLQTISSPPIYYLPAKHTKETEDLVMASVEAHEEKMQAATREHQVQLRETEAEFQTKLDKLREQLEEAKREEDDGGRARSGSKGSDDASERAEKTAKRGGDGDDAAMSDGHSNHEDDEADTSTKSPIKAREHHSDSDGDAMDEEPSSARVAEGDGNADGHLSDGDVSSKVSAGEPAETKQLDEAKVKSTDAKDDESSAPQPETPEGVEQSSANGKDEDTSTEVVATAMETSAAPEELQRTPKESKLSPAIDVSKMRVADLRAELKKRGLDTKGLKAQLMERLEAVIGEESS